MSEAFKDISTNPANIAKYQDNPKVKALIEKLAGKFGSGAGGSPFGDAGGPFGGAGGPFGGAAPGSGSTGGSMPQQPDID